MIVTSSAEVGTCAGSQFAAVFQFPLTAFFQVIESALPATGARTPMRASAIPAGIPRTWTLPMALLRYECARSGNTGSGGPILALVICRNRAERAHVLKRYTKCPLILGKRPVLRLVTSPAS